MDRQPAAHEPISDRDLVLQFESVGDNCELGLVQRRAGAEPLGLLRFAGAPLRHLLTALASRFTGLADPGHIQVTSENGEFMVKLTRYEFTYHTHVLAGDADPDGVHQQQCRTLPFLVDKLIGDLENPTKILVFRQNEPLSATDLTDLRLALSAYGPGVLLWVETACEGHPPGTVVVVDDRLMVGYVRRLAHRDHVPDLDVESWMTVLRRAYALWRDTGGSSQRFAAACLPRTTLFFGREGNAAAAQGHGWSAPEPGYTWSIGERSVLNLVNPGLADEYWLEMDVKPFTCPPALPRQSLDVAVEGTVVRRLDPLPTGVVTCVVPGRLVSGQDSVSLELRHPHAASPAVVSGQDDERRLAISFRRVSLFCT